MSTAGEGGEGTAVGRGEGVEEKRVWSAGGSDDGEERIMKDDEGATLTD